MKLFKFFNDKSNVSSDAVSEPEVDRNGVMIVDDSRFSRNVLRDILENEGFEVVGEAGDGQEAVDKAKELSPEIIFLDVEMPVLDGLGALPKIMKYDSGINIIMCTALGQKKIIMEATRAGAKDYVIKPYRKENITDVLIPYEDAKAEAKAKAKAEAEAAAEEKAKAETEAFFEVEGQVDSTEESTLEDSQDSVDGLETTDSDEMKSLGQTDEEVLGLDETNEEPTLGSVYELNSDTLQGTEDAEVSSATEEETLSLLDETTVEETKDEENEGLLISDEFDEFDETQESNDLVEEIEEVEDIDTLEEEQEEVEDIDTLEEEQEEVEDIDTLEEEQEEVEDIDTLEEEQEEVEDIDTLEEEQEEVEDIDTLEEEQEEIEDIETLEEEQEEVEDIDTLEEEQEKVEDIDTLEEEQEEVEDIDTLEEEQEEVEDIDTLEEEQEEIEDIETPEEEQDLWSGVFDKPESEEVVETSEEVVETSEEVVATDSSTNYAFIYLNRFDTQLEGRIRKTTFSSKRVTMDYNLDRVDASSELLGKSDSERLVMLGIMSAYILQSDERTNPNTETPKIGLFIESNESRRYVQDFFGHDMHDEELSMLDILSKVNFTDVSSIKLDNKNDSGLYCAITDLVTKYNQRELSIY